MTQIWCNEVYIPVTVDISHFHQSGTIRRGEGVDQLERTATISQQNRNGREIEMRNRKVQPSVGIHIRQCGNGGTFKVQ